MKFSLMLVLLLWSSCDAKPEKPKSGEIRTDLGGRSQRHPRAHDDSESGSIETIIDQPFETLELKPDFNVGTPFETPVQYGMIDDKIETLIEEAREEYENKVDSFVQYLKTNQLDEKKFQSFIEKARKKYQKEFDKLIKNAREKYEEYMKSLIKRQKQAFDNKIESLVNIYSEQGESGLADNVISDQPQGPSKEREDRRWYWNSRPKFYKSENQYYPRNSYFGWFNFRKMLQRWWYHHHGSKKTTLPPTEAAPTVLKFDEWLDMWNEEADSIECGLGEIEPRMVDLRIVGGTTAIRGSWPWMVSMKLAGQHWCGGVLISKKWVVSSAHCMLFMPGVDDPKRWEIRLGRFNPAFNITEPESEQTFNISGEPIFYKGIDVDKIYSGIPVDNDIVLLKLDHPVTITRYVKPICLPRKPELTKHGERCVITGYGQTKPNIGSPVKLKQAIIPVVEYTQCKKLKGYEELLTTRMLCAGYLRYGGVDTCKMDSGGPLQCFKNGRWVVSGLTSWGDGGGSGCAKPLRPGVYTDIISYVDWIYSRIYQNYLMEEKQ